MQRGEMWWANLREPLGSEPGYRRPVLIISIDELNTGPIQTVIAVILTSNLLLANSPGNVLLPSLATGLERDSVINVSQLLTIDKGFLSEFICELGAAALAKVEAGLRLVMGL